MPLSLIEQDEFRAGMFRSVARHLIPPDAAYTIVDALLDDDGSIYRRGGSKYKSNAVFANPLRFIWDGYLNAVGQRTLVGHTSAFGILTPGDDATPLAIGGAGLVEPKPTAQVGDILWIGGGTLYGGSQKAANYSTGTITTVAGSTAIIGAGTTWVGNVDAGMLFQVTVGDTVRYYVVASVTDNTHIVLTEPYLGTAGAGQAYVASPLATAGPISTIGANRGLAAAEFYAAVAGRLVCASGRTVYMSNPIDPTTGKSRPQIYSSTDFHELPEGTSITGLHAIRDRLLVFTTAGVWMISGLAAPIVDASGNAQHRKEQLSTDLVLWGNPGIATWQNQAIVPTTDGVLLMDGVSAPENLTWSIRPVVQAYVRQGYKPGQAVVYHNHYFLPIMDASNIVVDVLVCRLDRPVWRGRHIPLVYPWVLMRGHAGQITGLATRAASGTARVPALLAAGADKRVLDLSAIFEPAVNVKDDADGSTHQLLVESRDYPTSPRQKNRNTVTRLRARYGLVDGSGPLTLVNPSFETNLNGWNDIGNATNTLFARNTVVDLSVTDGVCSLHTTSTMTASNQFMVARYAEPGPSGLLGIPVSPSRSYTMRADAYVQTALAGSSLYIQMTWFDATGVQIGQTASVQQGGAATGTRQFAVTGTSPPGAAFMRPYLWFAGGATLGTLDAYWDNLRLSSVAVPTLLAYYSTGALPTTGLAAWDTAVWDAATWPDLALTDFTQLTGGAPADDGRHPFTWSGWAAKTQFIRFQIRTSGPAASCAIRGLEAFVRDSGNVW